MSQGGGEGYQGTLGCKCCVSQAREGTMAAEMYVGCCAGNSQGWQSKQSAHFARVQVVVVWAIGRMPIKRFAGIIHIFGGYALSLPYH